MKLSEIRLLSRQEQKKNNSLEILLNVIIIIIIITTELFKVNLTLKLFLNTYVRTYQLFLLFQT